MIALVIATAIAAAVALFGTRLLIVVLGVYPKPVMDRIEPSVEIILDRIETVTDYEAPEFGRTDDLVEIEYGPIVHDDESHGDEEGGG